jgi:hypothetical protein
LGCLAADEPALDAVLLGQHLAHVPTVLHSSGEDQHRLAILGQLDDLGARGLDEGGLVHHRFDFTGDELAGPDVQLRRISLGDPPPC